MSKAELLIARQETLASREACGITAIFSKTGENVSPMIPPLQHELQHRGYDSAGIGVWNNGAIDVHVGRGKVKEVFPPDFPFKDSDRGVGHNRYGTSGGANKDDVRGSQPVVSKYGSRKLALAYNGNLPDEVREKLKLRIPEELQDSMFDTEDIANAIVSAEGGDWEEKIRNGLNGIELAYSLTLLTDDGRVFGLRGPSGTWPLWYGETEDKIIFASETRVYKDENIKWEEVEPGELVEATPTGVSKRKIFEETTPLFRCTLHDTYGGKEDSLMTKGVKYETFRRELGRELAREHPMADVDLIVGVPETGLVMAEGYAEELGRKPTVLIKKNTENKESESRGFIAPDLDKTSIIVSRKYKIEDKKQARDKRILLIDDSLIRGKTMGGDPKKNLKGVVGFVRDAGAEKIHLAVVLPKFVNGCDMGYYIEKGQLIALVKKEDGLYEELDEKAVATRIGADSVHYLSIDGIKNVYKKFFGNRNVACMACMGQPHPLDVIEAKSNGQMKKEAVVYPNSDLQKTYIS